MKGRSEPNQTQWKTCFHRRTSVEHKVLSTGDFIMYGKQSRIKHSLWMRTSTRQIRHATTVLCCDPLVEDSDKPKLKLKLHHRHVCSPSNRRAFWRTLRGNCVGKSDADGSLEFTTNFDEGVSRTKITIYQNHSWSSQICCHCEYSRVA